MSKNKFEGPQWNITSEYPSFESGEFQGDLTFVKDQLQKIKYCVTESFESAVINLDEKIIIHAQKIIEYIEETSIILFTLTSYTHCVLTVDGVHEEGKKMNSELEDLVANYSKSLLPFQRFMTCADLQTVEKICATEKTKGYFFQAKQSQFWKDYLLSPGEEDLVKVLETDGLHAWGNLYEHLSVKLKCQLKLKNKIIDSSLTQTMNYLYSIHEEERKAAYFSLKEAWHAQEESCASILNSVAGFRLKLLEQRSRKKTLHYLEPVTHANHMSQKSLASLMGALEKNKNLGQKSNRVLAKILNKRALDPWDLLAPAPQIFDRSETKVTFQQAIEKIERCFSQVSPLMGIFVRTVAKNNWIEGSHSPKKRAGGYCTKFMKSKEPRIFMTYDGSLGNVSTLAHELGHAYHSWVMRDLSFHEKHYTMSLAETASIFSETLLFEELLRTAQSPQEKLNLMWEDVSNISAFLINIPTRFSFEKDFYDQKLAGQYFSPERLTELNNKHFQNWYGDTLREPHSYFWMSKLHFYLTRSFFYNFPYSFGYLFGLKVFSKKEILKEGFHDFYVSLLRDTGRMSAEDLMKKHFEEDLEDPDFWDSAMGMIEKKLLRIQEFLMDHPLDKKKELSL